MTTRRRISTAVSTASIVCAAILVYVFGSFRLAEILGVKRALEALLLLPLVVVALHYFATRPRTLLNPLIAFALVKLVLEVYWRGDPFYIAEACGVVAALIVVSRVPDLSVRTGARVLVWVGACFALMALTQWVLLFVFPGLAAQRVPVSDDGMIMVSVDHPITLLGLFSDPDWTLFGRPVGRLQSFAREPSLTLVFFYLPACLALYLNTKSSRRLAYLLLTFSVLSFSGSVLLSLVFGACWWLLSKPIRIQLILPWGILILTALYLYSLLKFGVDALLNASAALGEISGLLARSASITDRALPAIANFKVALASPFGNRTLSDAPGPLLIDAALAAGWLGVLLLTIFLRDLGRQLDRRFARGGTPDQRLATFLLIGGLTTVIVFSDYAMTTYPGLLLLMILYRLTRDESCDSRLFRAVKARH